MMNGLTFVNEFFFNLHSFVRIHILHEKKYERSKMNEIRSERESVRHPWSWLLQPPPLLVYPISVQVLSRRHRHEEGQQSPQWGILGRYFVLLCLKKLYKVWYYGVKKLW